MSGPWLWLLWEGMKVSFVFSSKEKGELSRRPLAFEDWNTKFFDQEALRS